ncbi:nuclear transport factor 2 family protein [Tenacibaculum sp. nBUS_03]|uniref:nuclear transport factor 2 family protein n=1 Tax=Tenacibaculum sp. nBUS_03 TaxID=3395320 RepID=UPI003EBC0F45
MENNKLVEKFYSSFSSGNIEKMTECYHKDILFHDPVFGTLKGERVLKMWEMLLNRRTNKTKISFTNIETTMQVGTANWTAKYIYGENNRKVINMVSASFKFKDGKIIEHIDTFNLWKWTQQAIGVKGYLIGWPPFMKKKIQKMAKSRLDNFINK